MFRYRRLFHMRNDFIRREAMGENHVVSHPLVNKKFIIIRLDSVSIPTTLFLLSVFFIHEWSTNMKKKTKKKVAKKSTRKMVRKVAKKAIRRSKPKASRRMAARSGKKVASIRL
jgi:hypothetical protein